MTVRTVPNNLSEKIRDIKTEYTYTYIPYTIIYMMFFTVLSLTYILSDLNCLYIHDKYV